MFPNLTWTDELDNPVETEGCIVVPYDVLADRNFSSKLYLAERNFSMTWDTLKWAQIHFSLKVINITVEKSFFFSTLKKYFFYP